MLMIVSQATITVSRFDRNGVRVDIYRDLEHMLTIRVWDASKYRDAHPSCNRHSDCKAADAKWLESHPDEKFVPFNIHCHDEECEGCFGS